MIFEEIERQLRNWSTEGKRVFATSSFQTHSLPMLHMLSRIDTTIPIVFINTGYLFPETIEYRDEITKLLNLNLVNVFPQVSKINQRDDSGRLYFTSDPDFCCYLNKVQPLEPYLQKNDIWINGIRADQNENRNSMGTFSDAPHGCSRFHPVLDWTVAMVYDYVEKYKLPSHPLNAHGYVSVGCEPCTARHDFAGARTGRWIGQNKTECGLHTVLSKKQP